MFGVGRNLCGSSSPTPQGYPSRVPSPPHLYLNSSVPWGWAGPCSVAGCRGSTLNIHRGGKWHHFMEAPAWSMLRATMLRVFLWFLLNIVWPVLRPKWAFHCPALVRSVCLCSQTFRWSRAESEDCQLGRLLGLSRGRQCLCHTLLWTTVFLHFAPQTFALNPVLKTIVCDSSCATFILQCVGRS